MSLQTLIQFSNDHSNKYYLCHEGKNLSIETKGFGIKRWVYTLCGSDRYNLKVVSQDAKKLLESPDDSALTSTVKALIIKKINQKITTHNDKATRLGKEILSLINVNFEQQVEKPHTPITISEPLPSVDQLPELKYPNAIPKSNYVLPRVIMGGYPSGKTEDELQKMQKALANEAVTHFICLMPTEELEGKAGKPAFRRYEETALRLNPQAICRQVLAIPDLGTVEDHRVLQVIDYLLSALVASPQNKMYLHCHGGNGRTSLITTILLSRLYKIPFEDAMTHVYRCYLTREEPVLAHLPETLEQFEQMKRLCYQPEGKESTLSFADWSEQCKEVQETVRPGLFAIASTLVSHDDASFGKLVKSTPIDAPKRVGVNQELFRRLMGPKGVYHDHYRIKKNAVNVMHSLTSPDCLRHQKSVKIYHEKGITQKQAMAMATMREPVNIEQERGYDKRRAELLLGNGKSYFESEKATSTKTPVTSLYSETFWWNPPGSQEKPKELVVLSVYAPALDSKEQPHVEDFVDLKTKTLQEEAYKDHMRKMAESIVVAAAENRHTAFEGKGIKRVVIPLVGQANFIKLLDERSKELATNIFADTLAEALKSHEKELEGLEVVLSEYFPDEGMRAYNRIKEKVVSIGMIPGDIGELAAPQDLIINAWDPHSAPGNGNDGDNSFDGQVGRRSTVLLTTTSWFNRSPKLA